MLPYNSRISGRNVSSSINLSVKERTPPNEYICRITQETMEYPVIVADGYNYECSAIDEWLTRDSTSPMRWALQRCSYIPNRSLKRLIHDWKNAPSGTDLTQSVYFNAGQFNNISNHTYPDSRKYEGEWLHGMANSSAVMVWQLPGEFVNYAFNSFA